MFVSVTEDWQGPRGVPTSAEDVLVHIGDIERRDRLAEFHSVTDEFEHVARGLGLSKE